MAAEYRPLTISRRRLVQGAALAGLGLVAGCGAPLPLRPMEPRVARIGWLSGISPSPATGLDAFRQGMTDLGYVEDQQFHIEARYADGDASQLPELAAELARLPVDLIVAAGGIESPGAARDAARTLPVVMVTAGDPVRLGYVESLGRPGGNVTGLTLFSVQLAPKRFELLKEAVPSVARVVYFYLRPHAELEHAAAQLGVELRRLEITDPAQIESAFETAVRWGAEALLHNGDVGVSSRHRSRITALAAQHHLPAMYFSTEFVRDGGLMGYAANTWVQFRRAAYYVDRILKGTKPADLPVEQPREFELAINLKTAQTLGLAIPQHVLLQATEIIQ